MSTGSHSHGFTLVEALVSLLLLSVIIVSFLSLLTTFSNHARIQGNLAETGESARYSIAALTRMVRMAGAGGLPLLVRGAEGGLVPLAVDLVDNAAGTNALVSSISGLDWGIRPNRPPIGGTDVLRIRGVLTTPTYDVAPGDFSPGRLRVPGVSPWSGRAQELVAMPSGLGRALLVSMKSPMDIRPAIGGIRRYGLFRVVEVTNNPSISENSLEISFDDGDAEAYAAENPGGATATIPSQSYAAGFVDDLVYYVARNNFDQPSLYRLRVHSPGGAVTAEELVPNVSDFQLALGCDVNLNQSIEETEWFFERPGMRGPTVDQFTALKEIRLSVVGRTGAPDPKWRSRVEIPENGSPLSGKALQFRYRVVSECVALRSHPPLMHGPGEGGGS